MRPNIFVFTAGNPEARQHLADSIVEPIDEDVVFDNFPEAHHEELTRIRERGNGFYAWGAVPGPTNRRIWEAMERGDYVLCVYDNNYRYVAQVLAKYDNRELAEAVWGTNDQGQAWRLMYFLTEPREIHLSLSEVANHLHRRYQGFTKISDERLDAIAEAYGAVEEFVERASEHTDQHAPWFSWNTLLAWKRNCS